MRIKIQEIGPALHPSERIVEVTTSKGKDRLIVDRRAIETGTLSIGSPIARKGDLWLVELPRETMSGSWRVWVRKNVLVADARSADAA